MAKAQVPTPFLKFAFWCTAAGPAAAEAEAVKADAARPTTVRPAAARAKRVL